MTSTIGTNFVIFFFFSTMSLFSERLTGTAAFAGYMSMAYSITALVIRPIAGSLSDKHGRVRLIIIGAAVCVIACILYAVTTNLIISGFAAGLTLLVVIRALNGLGFSLNNTSAGAAVPDVAPKERMAEGVAMFGMNFTIAQAIGPFIALAIVGSGELHRFNMLFYLSAGLCAVSLISGCFIKYERGQNPRRHEKSAPESTQGSSEPDIKAFLGFEPPVFVPALLIMILYIGLSSVMSYITLYGDIRGFQVEQLGWFFFTSAAGVAAARLLFGKIADKRGPDIIIIPGIILIAISLLLIPFSPSILFLILLGAPYGLATGAVSPPLSALMFKRCSAKRRGTASAAFTMAIDAGVAIGAPVMGLIADNISFDWVFRIASALAIIALLIYICNVSEKSHARRQAKRIQTAPE